MLCTKVTGSGDQWLDPGAPGWAAVAPEAIKLDATPLANQPSEYIKASRDEKQVGRVRNLSVQAAHTDADVFFRLTWEDPNRDAATTDITVFPDGCGILMPLRGGDPPIDEMGSKDFPVNAWYWRADFTDTARNTIGRGLGTTEYTAHSPIRARAVWDQGRWTVVFARALTVPAQRDETVQLAVGAPVKVGFAVWEGSNGERAGIKAFSKEWRELTLQA